MTAIGFLFLAAVFGILGFAALKTVPLYLEKMSVKTVLGDVEQEMATGGYSAISIRNALDARFYIEALEIPAEEISVKREGNGFIVRIDRESRAPLFGDLSIIVDIDEQVEIPR